MPRRIFCGAWFLIVLLAIAGCGAFAQLSGRFGLDLVARRIPTTLTGEIKLDTPSEFVMLEFAIASNLIINASFGFVDLDIDAVVNTAGPEHCIIKAPLNLDKLTFYEVEFDKLSIVPEMWFAVPFEAVTDVNNLPNSVIIPPGDIMFVKARVTLSTSISGFQFSQPRIFLYNQNPWIPLHAVILPGAESELRCWKLGLRQLACARGLLDECKLGNQRIAIWKKR